MDKLLNQLIRTIFPPAPKPAPQTTAYDVEPIKVRVLSIIHNPVVKSEDSRKLSQLFRHWSNPDMLATNYIADMRQASYGYVNYEIVERIEVSGYPVKKDGYVYDDATLLGIMRNKQPFHEPDAVDYLRLVDEFKMVDRINANQIDEVWLFGMPYAGYYESLMAGPDAFWCNAPPLKGTLRANRRFVIMGYNYERGVGEMLENMGHRIESIMNHVWRNIPDHQNLYQQFIRYDKKFPGQAECGNVHFAPNSERDYDWGNKRPVPSYCDDWYHFPQLLREQRMVNSEEWGGGNIRLHHMWWMRHLPHVSGETLGIKNNWWEYVMIPDRV
ncbi:MAG: hypothetical protein L0154_15020 [Chloroflexi bacterium]|nr:hypothetical protein [Chloroflexota bacterium]